MGLKLGKRGLELWKMGLLKSKLIVLAKERNNLIAPHTPISP